MVYPRVLAAASGLSTVYPQIGRAGTIHTAGAPRAAITRAEVPATPSPPDLVERFTSVTDRLMAEAPDVSRRKMFGYPACFAAGHLFTSLHEDRWIVRLPELDQAELTALGATAFEPMAGRPMRGFLVVPAALRDDDAAIDDWVRRALAAARSMPPK